MSKERDKLEAEIEGTIDFYLSNFQVDKEVKKMLKQSLINNICQVLLHIAIEDDEELSKEVNDDIKATEKEYYSESNILRLSAYSGAFQEKFRWAEFQRRKIMRLTEK